MSVLNKVTVQEAGERTTGYDAVRTRRKKLAAAIQHQSNLLAASEAGETYRRTKTQRKQDLETDEVFEVQRQRRVVPWWWVDDSGQVMFRLRYGSAILKVKDGKDVMVFATIDQLKKLLPPLRLEVLAGGLDAALADAAADLQARFKANKAG